MIRFNGVEISDLNHLINVVSMAPIGQLAELVIWRGNKALSLKVTVGERDRALAQVLPVDHPTPSPTPRPGTLLRRPDRPEDGNGAGGPSSLVVMGVELATLDPSLALRLGLPESSRGAAVLDVAPESPLAHALARFDVITTVNGRSVASAEEALRHEPGPGI